MPSVLKSDVRPTSLGNLEFIEWSYGDWKPSQGQLIAWFTPETRGGVGLFALGQVTSDARPVGRNAKGNSLVSFTAGFDRFQPRQPLQKAHFRALPRVGAGSPMQFLNRVLYMNSHVKVAEIDSETFQLLADRF